MEAAIPDTASSQGVFRHGAALRAAHSALRSLQVNAAPQALSYPSAPAPAGHGAAVMSQAAACGPGVSERGGH